MASGKTLQTTLEIGGVLSPSLQAAINKAVSNLSDMSEELLESADAATRLVAEMDVQEDVLKTLQKAYAGYAAQGEESSDQAQELADKIRTVSGELEENRGTLRAAEQAAARLTESQENAGDAYTKLEDIIGSQRAELTALERQYAAVVLEQGEGAEAADDFARKIAALSGDLEKNEGALKSAQQAAARLTESQEDAGDAYAKLEKKIESQQSELAALRRQYANVALEQGESSAEARQLENRISSLSGELRENKQKLSEAERAADSLGDALEDAGEKAADSSEGYTVLKDVLADLVTNGIEKAVDAFKELATEGDSALSKLEAKTGASAAEIEGFEDVMYEVYNANYGENLGAVSDALSTVIQMTDDLDNASLAKVTKNAIALEDVFGYDTTESMRAVNSLMDQFGITSDQAFNLVVQGAQKGLDQNGDLLDTINEYSVQFKNAGYSADDMFNMLANGTETGTWSVDKLGDAVKEFNIRMSDGTASEYLEELGVDTDDLMEKFNTGGADAQEAIGTVMDAILECDDATLQYQTGVGLFGTMWEDLGADTVAALMKTEGAIDSTADAMGKMDAAAYDNLESSLSQLGRTVKAEVVQPIADKLIPVAKDAVDVINGKVAPAVDWLTANLPYLGVALGAVGAVITAMQWGKITEGVGKAVSAFKGIGTAISSIPAPVLIIIGVIAALAAGFAYLWETSDSFRESMTGVWEQLQGSFSQLGETFSALLAQLMPILTTLVTTVLTQFASLLEVLLPVLAQIVAEVLIVAVDLLSQLLPIIMQVVTAVLPILVQLIQSLLPLVVQIAQTVLPALLQLVQTFLPIIMQVVNAVLPVLVQILNALTPILDLVISLLQPILDLFIAILSPVLNLISIAIKPLIQILGFLVELALKPVQKAITVVANVITAVLGAAIETVKPIIQGLQKYFQGLIDFISGVFSGNWSKAWDGIVKAFGGIWDTLVGIVKAPINGVISLINKAIGALNGINVKIPDWVPAIGGKSFGVNLPKIPMLAEGGFTDGISIAGEKAMEAVISFDPAYRDKNIGIWEKAGQLLGVLGSETQGGGLTGKAGELLTLDDFSLGSLADGTNVVIYYDFSGFTWSPQIHADGTDNDEDDIIARLKAHEAEFFDWLEEFIRMREVAQYA